MLAKHEKYAKKSEKIIRSTPVRFELTRAEPSRFLIYRLNHSAIVPHAQCANNVRTSAAGFEPTRAEPNRFQVYRLNHSAMLTRIRIYKRASYGI